MAENIEEVVILDSNCVALSEDSDPGCTKMIIVSRLGVEWLVDVEDLMTVKLMSVHTKPITCCDYNTTTNTIITGSEDGTIKLTDSTTLEVSAELYKPKKVVHSVLYIEELSMLVGSHGNTLCFYEGSVVLGSWEMDAPAVSLQHIPQTRNILVGTQKEVLMVQLLEEEPFRIEIERIADFPNLLEIEINEGNPSNMWLCSSSCSKVNVWNRKSLKRNSDPLL